MITWLGRVQLRGGKVKGHIGFQNGAALCENVCLRDIGETHEVYFSRNVKN
jgi:hypothetical protein